MAKVIGQRELIDKKEGFSYGAHEMRDGVSIHEERRQEPIVKPSAFLCLEDLSAFLKLPGNWPVARLEFQLQSRPCREEAFVPRDLKQWLLKDNTPEPKPSEQNVDSNNSESPVLQTEYKTKVPKPLSVGKKLAQKNLNL
jgi:hypothetical protein